MRNTVHMVRWRRRGVIRALVAVVTAVGCGTPSGPMSAFPEEVQIGGVVIAADVSVGGAELMARVSFRNQGPGLARLEIDGCRVRIRAFATAARRGEALWDVERLNPNCSDRGRQLELEPGDAAEELLSLPVTAVLGDSLADGRYYFVAKVVLDGSVVEVDAGSARLAED